MEIVHIASGHNELHPTEAGADLLARNLIASMKSLRKAKVSYIINPKVLELLGLYRNAGKRKQRGRKAAKGPSSRRSYGRLPYGASRWR